MKIAIGSDHAGFAYKEKVKALLLSLGHEVKDLGAPPYNYLRCGIGIGERIDWARIARRERQNSKRAYLGAADRSTLRPRSGLFHRVVSPGPVGIDYMRERVSEHC